MKNFKLTLPVSNRIIWFFLCSFITLSNATKAAEEDLEIIPSTSEASPIRFNKAPNYPASSMMKNETGTVLIDVLVTELGTVKELSIKKSSGHKELDSAAIEAVRDWKFIPKRANEVVMESWTIVPVTFSMDNHPIDQISITSQDRYWAKDKNGCKLFDRNLQANADYSWDGRCSRSGYIYGEGLVEAHLNGKLISTMKGTFKKGLLNGRALTIIPSGTYYEGNYIDGIKSGKGSQTWTNGNKYEGDFLNNTLNGHGIFTWKNGARYEGEFLQGSIADNVEKKPELIKTSNLVYPSIMLRSGSDGEVILSASVDDKGALSDIKVIKSQHPAFEKAAIKAFTTWKVKPATVNAQAIPSNIIQPFMFRVSNNLTLTLPYEFEPDKSQKLASQFQFDTPPKDLIVAPTVYPYELIQDKITGSVTASLVIDPKGNPSDIRIIETSHKEFASSIKAMLLSSTFTPAMKSGVATWSRFIITRTFNRNSYDIQVDKDLLRLLDKLKNNAVEIFKLSDLDNKPNVLYNPLPTLPKSYKLKNDQEQVIIEFNIDKKGSVQLPRIIKSQNEDLGWLALTAVSRWQFEAPKKNGAPVDVVARIPIIFSSENFLD